MTIPNLPANLSADDAERLDELTRQADVLLREAEKTIVQTQVDLGHIFIEVKALVRTGVGFMAWLRGRRVHQRAANRAMELAKKHKRLTETDWTLVSTFEHLSFRQALAFGKPASKTKNRPRPRGKDNGGQQDQIEIEPPDLAHSLVHLAQRWTPSNIAHYEPNDAQLDLLAESTVQLLPALVAMLEQHDISIPVCAASRP
jgi:hypothetical protein